MCCVDSERSAASPVAVYVPHPQCVQCVTCVCVRLWRAWRYVSYERDITRAAASPFKVFCENRMRARSRAGRRADTPRARAHGRAGPTGGGGGARGRTSRAGATGAGTAACGAPRAPESGPAISALYRSLVQPSCESSQRMAPRGDIGVRYRPPFLSTVPTPRPAATAF
jgi:hypothetical protein